jgi:hypothetical protein
MPPSISSSIFNALTSIKSITGSSSLSLSNLFRVCRLFPATRLTDRNSAATFEIGPAPALSRQGDDDGGRAKAVSLPYIVSVFVPASVFSKMSLQINLYGHQCIATPVRFRDANLHRVRYQDGSNHLPRVFFSDDRSRSEQEIQHANHLVHEVSGER